MSRHAQHTYIAYVEDRPGSLARVVSLFRRRGYNIDSLTVGHTDRPLVSRVTVVLQADEDTARRIEANLYKLVNVLFVEKVSRADSVLRELALIKVRIQGDKRAEVLQLCEVFRARVVDVGPGSLVVETTGAPDKVDGLLEVLRPFGIVEMVRTGAVAMSRGSDAPAALTELPIASSSAAPSRSGNIAA